jgi:hypothetical protein
MRGHCLLTTSWHPALFRRCRDPSLSSGTHVASAAQRAPACASIPRSHPLRTFHRQSGRYLASMSVSPSGVDLSSRTWRGGATRAMKYKNTAQGAAQTREVCACCLCLCCVGWVGAWAGMCARAVNARTCNTQREGGKKEIPFWDKRAKNYSLTQKHTNHHFPLLVVIVGLSEGVHEWKAKQHASIVVV